MSRSQFQSKIFILRHAWLNLWDERMTTGRINQVANIKTLNRRLVIQNIGPFQAAKAQSNIEQRL